MNDRSEFLNSCCSRVWSGEWRVTGDGWWEQLSVRAWERGCGSFLSKWIFWLVKTGRSNRTRWEEHYRPFSVWSRHGTFKKKRHKHPRVREQLSVFCLVDGRYLEEMEWDGYQPFLHSRMTTILYCAHFFYIKLLHSHLRLQLHNIDCFWSNWSNQFCQFKT